MSSRGPFDKPKKKVHFNVDEGDGEEFSEDRDNESLNDDQDIIIDLNVDMNMIPSAVVPCSPLRCAQRLSTVHDAKVCFLVESMSEEIMVEGDLQDITMNKEYAESDAMISVCSDETVLSKKSESSGSLTNITIKPKKTCYMHCNRLDEDDVSTTCFVCKNDADSSGNNEKLLQCTKKYGHVQCTSRFHMSCLLGYDAGTFNAEYMRSLVGTYVCPLHHCDLCWFERKKTTAVTGPVLQCKKCYRAFHEECRPAGAGQGKQEIVVCGEDGQEVKLGSTECYVHSRDGKNKIVANNRSNLPFCCECEQKGSVRLVKCSHCIRSYHDECHQVEKIKGNHYADNHKICEACIIGESIRVGQKLIAKYMNSFYPCTAVDISQYPEHCKSADKFGAYLGDPGFVAVSWAGCQNLFSLLPTCTVVPMFTGSYHLIGKRMRDNDIRNAWQEMDENIDIPRPTFNFVGEKYTKIKTSVYHPDCQQKPKTKNFVDENDAKCECAENDVNRCGPNSKCQNRIMHQECPDECEAIPGGCLNRSMSRKDVNPHIEMREATGKGQGVFAKANIMKGDFIAEYAGELISQQEKSRRIDLSSASRNDEEKHYMMMLDGGRVIDCKHKGNIARFLNHSCMPNCAVDRVDVIVKRTLKKLEYDQRARIFALRDITAGEELCFDYDMNEFSAGCPLPECLCQAPNCTGKLGKTVQERKDLKLKAESSMMSKKTKHRSSRGTPMTDRTSAQKLKRGSKRAHLPEQSESVMNGTIESSPIHPVTDENELIVGVSPPARRKRSAKESEMMDNLFPIVGVPDISNIISVDSLDVRDDVAFRAAQGMRMDDQKCDSDTVFSTPTKDWEPVETADMSGLRPRRTKNE